ncbi:MAG: hypothetical protein QXZ70_06250 [Candidatus Bathyarchaeia archaeon]
MRIAKSPSELTQALILSFAVIVLASCASTTVTLPYTAQIETIQPDQPGLEIRATAGGGGEIEIINRTAQEVILLDEQGYPYVRIMPDGVYELLGSTWVKTKDTPVYYCHDPRLVYDGPEPDVRAPQVMKQWTITGQIGRQTFIISGQTVYNPNRISVSMVRPMTGMLGCLGLLIASTILFLVVRRKIKKQED